MHVIHPSVHEYLMQTGGTSWKRIEFEISSLLKTHIRVRIDSDIKKFQFWWKNIEGKVDLDERVCGVPSI